MKPTDTREYFCTESPYGKCYKNFPTENSLLQAIAYKLDEISKKLSHENPVIAPPPPGSDNNDKWV